MTGGVLNRHPLAPPMGFAPLGPACEGLDGDCSAISSHTLHGFWRLLAESAGASECQSASDSPQPTARRNAHPVETTLVRFSHLPDPEHSSGTTPGLLSSPFAGSCIAADSPTILRRPLPHPTGVVQDQPWVPSTATFTSHDLYVLPNSRECKEFPTFPAVSQQQLVDLRTSDRR